MRKPWIFTHLRISEAVGRAAVPQGFKRAVRFRELCTARVAGGGRAAFRPQRSSVTEKTRSQISPLKRNLLLASSPIAPPSCEAFSSMSLEPRGGLLTDPAATDPSSLQRSVNITRNRRSPHTLTGPPRHTECRNLVVWRRGRVVDSGPDAA